MLYDHIIITRARTFSVIINYLNVKPKATESCIMSSGKILNDRKLINTYITIKPFLNRFDLQLLHDINIIIHIYIYAYTYMSYGLIYFNEM
jgi:hypothetical protein